MKYSPTLSLIVAMVMLVAACGGEADPVGGETPADPDTPTTATDGHEDRAPLPLPPPAGQKEGEILDDKYRSWPNSARVEVNVPYEMTVGTHCGFGPIDFDGSFWEPDPSANTNSLPDPEDTGVIVLVSENEAIYMASTGIDISLTRMTEEYVDLDVCL